MSPTESQPLNLREYEALARARLPREVWDYYASGAGDELTLAENEAAFQRIKLRHRVLRQVGQRDLSCRVGEEQLPCPLLVAPMAFQRLACDAGELASARAAGRAGVPLVLSTLATRALEEVVAATPSPVWFQLYVYRDRAETEALVRRAEAAGCRALVVTVDAPLLGRRERDERNGFTLPAGLEICNLLAEGARRLEATRGSGLSAYVAQLLDPNLGWEDLAWLRAITRLPLWVKGIVHPADARLAVEHGASGVVVSNHGGRQLDTSIATIDALPAVAEAVAGRVPLLLDGGIRRGTDVLKALARGATAVLIGRPILWGLAAAGEAGAHRVLELLRAEIDLAAALCGLQRLDQASPDLLA